jgi:hypothetical protein
VPPFVVMTSSMVCSSFRLRSLRYRIEGLVKAYSLCCLLLLIHWIGNLIGYPRLEILANRRILSLISIMVIAILKTYLLFASCEDCICSH